MEPDFLKVGEETIDSEHAGLLATLDRLKQPPGATEGKEDLLLLLEGLGRDIRLHFADEEAVFSRIGMPEGEVRSHTFAHQAILRRYDALISEISEKPYTSRLDIYMLVHDWILVHCVRHDMRLKKFISSREGSE